MDVINGFLLTLLVLGQSAHLLANNVRVPCNFFLEISLTSHYPEVVNNLLEVLVFLGKTHNSLGLLLLIQLLLEYLFFSEELVLLKFALDVVDVAVAPGDKLVTDSHHFGCFVLMHFDSKFPHFEVLRLVCCIDLGDHLQVFVFLFAPLCWF